MARFEGGAITVGQLEDAARRAGAHLRARYRDPEHLNTLLAAELQLALLAEEARRRGYDQHPIVLRTVKEESVRVMLEQRAAEAAAAVKDERVEQAYDAEAAPLSEPARRRATHIVAATREEASALLARAHGMDPRTFRQFARESSRDQGTRTAGGDLGYFDARGNARERDGAVAPSIARAVFGLRELGELVPAPVKTEAGYSVVMLTGMAPARARTSEQVRAEIRERIVASAGTGAQEMADALRTQYAVETHPELLEALRLDPSSAAQALPNP